MIGLLIQELTDAFRNVCDIEGIVVIYDDICSFDLPYAIFLNNLKEHSVGVDRTTFFDYVFAILFDNFDVSFSGLEIIDSVDDQVLHLSFWNLDRSFIAGGCRRLW